MSDLVSFALAQLKPGVTPQTAPNALGAGDIGGTTAIQNRALVAIAGDGDQILEGGETGYVLSGVQSSNRVLNTATLNGADDPVQIKVHGRINTSTVGALSTDTALGFNSTWGFGVDNGPDSNNRNLNGGDSITWTLNERAGIPQRLQAVSFTVDRGTSTAATLIAIDFDGDVVRSGTYQSAQTTANADRALEFSAVHGDLVTIDFDTRTLTVNGQARTGAEISAFFAAYDVSPKNVLTIGGIGTAGFSLRDLMLQRTDYAGSPENQAPTVALTPVVSTLAENANTGQSIKVADIVVSDPDGVGRNDLSLAGAHAALFEIVDGVGGKELHLKAGTALDFETLTSLSVNVVVDDASTGTNPDASVPFTLAITDVKETYGTITLDGAIAEWPSTARLDAPGSGTEGYALYGSYQDEAFVLALQAPVAIGPNTTLWLNTDLNKATGHQIWGWAGGAEYNINFGVDGKPALYSGADGQTLVSDALPFRVSADGTVVEIALPSALVGGARSANVLVDVNNTVFLPSQYAPGGYRIGENSAPSITLTPVVSTLPENADTTTSIKVADIVVTDDGIGVNTLSLTGTHADLFAIVDGVSGKELHLKAGIVFLDYETLSNLTVTVAVDDPTIGATPDASINFTLPITHLPPPGLGPIILDGSLAEWPTTARLDAPSNGVPGYALYGSYQDGAFVLALQAPAGVAIGANTTLWFNTDLNTATGHQIWGWAGGAEYNINFGPDGRPALYTGADGQTLVSDALPFAVSADGTVLEIALPSALVGGARSANVLVDVNNTVFLPSQYAPGGYRIGENSAPSITLTPVVSTLPENADTTTSIKVADIVVTDDGIGVNTLSLTGTHAELFAIVDGVSGKELHLRAGVVLDYETLSSLSVTVAVDDPTIGATPDASIDFTLPITDLIELPPGEIILDGSLAEWPTTARLDTPGNGVPGYALYGSYQDGAFILGLQAPAGVAIGANTTLWFNTDLNTATGHQIWGWAGGAEYNINFGPDGRPALYTGADGGTLVSDALPFAVSADGTIVEIALPSALVGDAQSANLLVDVNNTVFLPNNYGSGGYRIAENSAPSITLTPVVSALAENANTTSSIKVADIVVSDPDGVGINTLSLIGTHADLFAIVDGLGGKELHLKAGTVLDYETLSSLSLNVVVDDASTSANPDASAPFTLDITDVKETYGPITLDGAIGEWPTTARLDAPGTGPEGYALYGSYQEDAFVIALQAPVAIGPNTTLWFNTDLNTTTGFQIFGWAGGAEYNINFDSFGRPALYTGADGQTLVFDALPFHLSADRTVVEIALPSALVGDARSANVLVDVNNTVFLPGDYGSGGYRIEEKAPLLPPDPSLKVAIVYSETSADHFYYKTAYGQLFMAAQNQAYQAGIPFDVISEDALTNVANLVGYDAIIFPGLSHVKAANLAAITTALTSASKDYGIGLIAAGNFLTNDETGAAIAGDSYARMKSLLGVTLEGSGATTGIQLKAAGVTHPVTDLYGSSEVVGNYGNISYQYFQDVSGNGQTLFLQHAGNQDLSAVIANTNGGRNVHFASDAIMGNNNILSEALNWSARGDAPDVGLQMTRGTSLFFSRNDMDQSQQTFDNPGIYAAMNPIVEQWYRDYGFVGSYYINIGNNPPDQTTDWAVSRPYYQQLLALESEIGTHSYTHPHDTNELTAAEIQFEFQQSKQVIENELGISVIGAAVPGAPENLQTSLEIIQYFDYMTGGYSATGAGYPGAFGFLTPDNADRVYFAPNTSFDFSLIGFRNLTPAQAEAVWAEEYAAIVEKGSTPIIHWPWHDYGPTQWNLGDGPSEYTLQMFTNFIQRAYNDGTEFVTGADLAQRIESFVASDVTISEEGGKIIAEVTGSDVGKFALETDQAVASVDNWYAFDGTKVFLPKGGGTFAINPGSQEADVTRIAELPMRAELVSANGNGTDLNFALNGRGDVKVDLKAWGTNSVIATGADSSSLSGEVLTLSFANLGNHSVNIDYGASDMVSGTAGNDFIIGGSDADTFVFSSGGGIDTVLDFNPNLDKISLVNSNFASAGAALQNFFQDGGGWALDYTATDRLVLANVTPGQIGEDHILLV